MAKLPSIKRLVPIDYPDQKSWIEKLLQPLNLFMEGVNSALNRNLTIADNLDGQVTQLEVTGGIVPVYIKAETRNRPKVVLVGDCREKSTGTAADGPIYVSWDYMPKTQQIRLNGITSLTTGTKYLLTLAITAG